MLKCEDCNNTESFYVGVKEYHTWKIDGNRNFISDIDSSDNEMSDDFRCAKCDSWFVKEE